MFKNELMNIYKVSAERNLSRMATSNMASMVDVVVFSRFK